MPVDVGTALYRKIKSDDAFIVSEVSSVTSGSTFNVHLKNPSDSDVVLWAADIRISSDGSYIGRVHDGFSSAPTGGSVAEIQAIRLDAQNVNNNGNADANTSVSFTADSTHAVGVSGGGGGGVTIGGSNTHTTLAIESGREIVVEVENTSASENNYGISIVYYERPA